MIADSCMQFHLLSDARLCIHAVIISISSLSYCSEIPDCSPGLIGVNVIPVICVSELMPLYKLDAVLIFLILFLFIFCANILSGFSIFL